MRSEQGQIPVLNLNLAPGKRSGVQKDDLTGEERYFVGRVVKSSMVRVFPLASTD
jgi:hypothetical protein